jgi:SPASM domain peptide maturase of grasp-with-spasm system
MSIEKKLEDICVLNPNAILVNGASRGTICDFEREAFSIIPLALSKILEENSTGFKIKEVVECYSKGDQEIAETILDYFQVLYTCDLLLFTEYPQYYPKIDLQWDFPGKISNAIVDIDQCNEYAVTFLEQVISLGCRFVQIRFFSRTIPESVSFLLTKFQKSILESIELLLPYESLDQTKNWENLLNKEHRIRTVTLFNAPEDQIQHKRTIGFGQVVTVKSNIQNAKSCGYISSDYFVSGISLFTESQHHNSCLNRKIAIDVDGNIKNCPSMPQSFGNIKDTTLQEALDHPDFKKYWNINKDQIAVCKDCEFRYICTDCRAYIENPENMYSKPLKCGYNPYTCEWEDWSTNPLKQKAIDYYGMREVLPEFKLQPDYVPPQRTPAESDPSQ